jgi:hypothetical protein
MAEDRLGKLLSEFYLGDKVHLEFECADGHRWKATPNTIKRGHWCPSCKNGKNRCLFIEQPMLEFNKDSS